ncbi:MAG: recombination protein RmuC, partial [Pseudomonadota bacterium]
MDSTLTLILVLVFGLAAGTCLGWFFGTRPVVDLRTRLAEGEAAARDLDARFRQAVKELGEASIENATLKANAANFEEQKAGLLVAQESLKKEFENAGAKILAQAQETLLNRAQERLSQSEEKSAERLKALLAPVDE